MFVGPFYLNLALGLGTTKIGLVMAVGPMIFIFSGTLLADWSICGARNVSSLPGWTQWRPAQLRWLFYRRFGGFRAI
ncbi:MAG: hypothetical protein WBA90_08355 [Albidovulum sp.]